MNNWYQAELTVQLLPRMVKEGTPHVVRTPADVLTVVADLRHSSQEVFAVITLNVRDRMIGRHVCTVGLLDGSLVHPREIFRRAIMDGAAAIVLVHNHPSGDPTPSAEDIRCTHQMVEAGKIIDIKVVDHVIVGESEEGTAKLHSMRESGVTTF